MDKTGEQPNPGLTERKDAGGETQVIQLSGNQTLVIDRHGPRESLDALKPGEECLRLLGSDGATRLTIRLTASGPVVELTGASLVLKVDGDLALAARRLLLHGS